jgi:hypothetical protein
MNLEDMTEEQINALYEKEAVVKSENSDLENMSDEEIDALYDKSVEEVPEEAQNSVLDSILSVGGKIVDAGMDVLEEVDARTVAPTKSAIKTLADTGSFSEAGGAFYDQFGKEPSTAPEGEEVARSLGVKNFDTLGGAYVEGNTPQEIQENIQEMPQHEQLKHMKVPLEETAGMAIDMFADPLMLVPVVPLARGVSKAGVGIAKGAAKASRNLVLRSSKAGRAIEKGVETVGKSAWRASQSVKSNIKRIFQPTQVEDFPRLKKILNDNDLIPANLDDIPESLEFGERSSVSTMAKVLRQDPLGEKRTGIFNKFIASVDGAIDSKVTKMAEDVGGDAYHGGEQLLNGYNGAVKELFDGAEVTYQNFNSVAPDFRLSEKSMSEVGATLERLKNKATRLTKSGIGEERSKARALLNDIKALSHATDSYSDVITAMQSVGRSAFKKKQLLERVPVDKQALQEIYFSIRKAVQKDINAFDPRLGASLEKQNKSFSKFFSETDGINKIIGKSDKDPKALFNKLIKNGSLNDLKVLKETIPAESFDNIRATYLNTLISKNPAHGSVSYINTIKNLDGKSRELAFMFEDAPELLQEFQDLLEVGKRSGEAILNYSGTDVSKRFREFLATVSNSAISEASLDASKQGARTRRVKKSLPKKPKGPKKPSKMKGGLGKLGKAYGDNYNSIMSTKRGLEGLAEDWKNQGN